jgi:hypothetical protein
VIELGARIGWLPVSHSISTARSGGTHCCAGIAAISLKACGTRRPFPTLFWAAPCQDFGTTLSGVDWPHRQWRPNSSFERTAHG